MDDKNKKIQHKHSDNDVIIRDHDGSFKILVDGKFVPLSEAESAAHAAEHQQKKPEPKKAPVGNLVDQKPPASGLGSDVLMIKAREAIKKSGVTFASQELAKRAEKALIPQLKGVRKPFETLEVFTKPVASGGVGLEKSEAERILAALGGEKPQERKPQLNVALTKKPASALKPMPPAPTRDIKPPEKIAAIAPLEKKAPMQPKREEKKKPVQAPNPALRDVKKNIPSAAIGPIQELSYSLIDWRRLGENPLDRVKKIESKLDVLEQDSYADRLSGIQAWHESEVVQQYEEIGLKSLEENKTVEQLLGAGDAQKLSFMEWKAIADLDERIRA